MYLYKLTESIEKTTGYLILVIDGTASMQVDYAYDKLVQALKYTFAERIKNKTIYSIQFGDEISDIEVCQCANKGNFN